MCYLLSKTIINQKIIYNQEITNLIQKNKVCFKIIQDKIKSQILPVSINEFNNGNHNNYEFKKIRNKIIENAKFDLVNINNSLIIDELQLPLRMNSLHLNKRYQVISFQVYLCDKAIRFEDTIDYTSIDNDYLEIYKIFYSEWRWLIKSSYDLKNNLIVYNDKTIFNIYERVYINGFVTNKLIDYLFQWKKRNNINEKNEDLEKIKFKNKQKNYKELNNLRHRLDIKNNEELEYVLRMFEFEEAKDINEKNDYIYQEVDIEHGKSLILYYIENDKSFDIRLGEGEIVAYFAEIYNGQISHIYCSIINLNIKRFFEKGYNIKENNGIKWFECSTKKFL